VTQVVEQLPSKCEVLSSNPSTTSKNKAKKKKIPKKRGIFKNLKINKVLLCIFLMTYNLAHKG
jgi:hypothetical protein